MLLAPVANITSTPNIIVAVLTILATLCITQVWDHCFTSSTLHSACLKCLLSVDVLYVLPASMNFLQIAHRVVVSFVVKYGVLVSSNTGGLFFVFAFRTFLSILVIVFIDHTPLSSDDYFPTYID